MIADYLGFDGFGLANRYYFSPPVMMLIYFRR